MPIFEFIGPRDPQFPELSVFAKWFSEDWEYDFASLADGAQIYFESLSPEQRRTLRAELSGFLSAFDGGPERDLELAWIGLGAADFDKDLGVSGTLAGFLRQLDNLDTEAPK